MNTLNSEQISAIVALEGAGHSISSISRLLNMSRSTIAKYYKKNDLKSTWFLKDRPGGAAPEGGDGDVKHLTNDTKCDTLSQ